FAKMDRNADGRLDAKEVGQMLAILRHRFGVEPKGPESPEIEQIVNRILKRLDSNRDGKISRDEARGPLAENFKRLDVNQDGYLDRKELRLAATRLQAARDGKLAAFAGVPA